MIPYVVLTVERICFSKRPLLEGGAELVDRRLDLGVEVIVEFTRFVDLVPKRLLFAVDELTGLIGAAAKMRPSKSVQDMEVSSLKKKFKDKKFAAGCSRDIIKQGTEMLGWPLDTLFENTLNAMKATEESVQTSLQALQG